MPDLPEEPEQQAPDAPPAPPSEPPSEPPPAAPQDRYGTQPRPGGRRLATLGAVVLLAAGVAIAAWFAFGSSTADIRGKEVGFEVLGPETIVMTFDVAKPRDVTVVCTLEALSSSYAQIGTKDVTVGPADVGEQRIRTEISTTEEAVTAVVDTCRVPD